MQINLLKYLVLWLFLPVINSLAGSEGKLETTYDWPQWRGMNRDGISHETGLLKIWPEKGPSQIWRVPLGEGFSGISISGGLAFTMYNKDKNEYAACFEVGTGKTIWQVRTDREFINYWGNGPRVTPAVNQGLVYFIGAKAKISVLDKKNGDIIWQKDLIKEFSGIEPEYGYCNSPLIIDDILFVPVGGSSNRGIMAFDKRSGVVIWSGQNDHPGYSSPIAVKTRGVAQIIFFTGTQISSLSPKDGRLIWKYPWRTNAFENAATPLFFAENKFFFSSAIAYDQSSAVLEIKGTVDKLRVEVLWRSNVMKNLFSTSVFHEGYLYGSDYRKVLKCIDAHTGEEKWRQRRLGRCSLILADGHLIILSSRGELALVEASSKRYIEKNRVQVLQGKCYTPPSLANGRLYLRNMIEMVCLDLKNRANP